MSPPQNEATHPRCCNEGYADGPGIAHHTEAFVGIDTSKLRNAVAIADGGRGGEVRYLGEFAATEAAIRKLVTKLAAKCGWGAFIRARQRGGPAHMRWLMEQKLEHREQRIVFEDLLEGIRQESERMERLEDAIREVV